MERYTSCTVELELYDTGAMDDSTFSVTNKQSFSDVESIREKNESLTSFATLENDFFLLDGSFNYYDTIDSLEEKTGYMSQYFTSTLKSVFSSYHSSVGITFHFYESIPNEIEIQFKDDDSEIEKVTFKPKIEDCEVNEVDNSIKLTTDDGKKLITSDGKYIVLPQSRRMYEYSYFAEMLVSNYNNVIINFKNSDRFVRLDYIDYGTKLCYGDDYDKKIKSASLTEEVDIFSSTLPIDESSIEVIDEKGMFDITNPKSYYQFLQKRQRFKIYETVDSVDKLVAVHYLKEWSQTKEMLASFDLQDVLGLMNETTFYGGMYTNVTASGLIDEIMEDYGFDDYTIEDDLKNITLNGYLKKQSHREALQQVAFAIGACVSTSRSTGIVIFKPLYENLGVIDSDRKLISTAHEITQKDLVTGVSLTAHSYGLDEKTSQATKGTFNPGNYRVTFSEPYTSLTITGATLVDSNCNYADIKVETVGEVVISGVKYVDNSVVYTYKNNTYASSIDENVLEVTDATLVNSGNVEDLLESIYKIKQYRLEHSLEIIEEEEYPSGMYAVKSNGAFAPLLITKLTSDLTGGYIAKAEGIGYALRINDYYKAGTELYAGSEGII